MTDQQERTTAFWVAAYAAAAREYATKNGYDPEKAAGSVRALGYNRLRDGGVIVGYAADPGGYEILQLQEIDASGRHRALFEDKDLARVAGGKVKRARRGQYVVVRPSTDPDGWIDPPSNDTYVDALERSGLWDALERVGLFPRS